jgi:hypothetical protein
MTLFTDIVTLGLPLVLLIICIVTVLTEKS